MTASLKLVKTASIAHILDGAKQVIAAEIAGLQQLEHSLGQSFVEAVALLNKVSGRIVVTGMGKSGHIARKIASTMSSTGTPALFVHPAEASHGDLGMIAPQDGVIAISNSGEAPELGDLIAYTRRFSIPLVAITKNPKSALGSAADIVLILPDAPEACPMGLAPTTSSTVTLALGDALAVCLLEQKGFSAENFRDLHPGGKLGQRLLKVSQLMHGGKEVPAVSPDALMKDVLIEISAKRFGCAAVVDANGMVLGVITDGDLRRHMNPNLLSQKAADVMTANPTAIGPNALAAEALGIMNKKSITSLLVVENGKLCGIVHVHDCLRSGIM